MKDLKVEIVKESIKAMANHYNTTASIVALAIQNGNSKLAIELEKLSIKTMDTIYA